MGEEIGGREQEDGEEGGDRRVRQRADRKGRQQQRDQTDPERPDFGQPARAEDDHESTRRVPQVDRKVGAGHR